MKAPKIALKLTVTDLDIWQVQRLRRTFEAQRKHLEMAENALAEAERSIIDRIQHGAVVLCRHEVRIKAIERRNVAWKSVCVELVGAEAAEKILADAVPSTSYRLLVKEAS